MSQAGLGGAVSRRRRLPREPLPRASQPSRTATAPAPAHASHYKKGLGHQKKQSSAEEESGGRRGHKSKAAHSVEVKPPVLEGPMPPKHIPFPQIPQEGELWFECTVLIFNVVATCLQLLNIYRAVWWLPDSIVDYAVNFDMIDGRLFALIVLVVSRRFLLVLVRTILPPKTYPVQHYATCMFVCGVQMGVIVWLGTRLSRTYTTAQMLYLMYPAVIYILVVCTTELKLLDIEVDSPPVLHNCGGAPPLRAEVERMRKDFNARVSRVALHSAMAAYYTSMVPCLLADPNVIYDVRACATQAALVLLGLAARHTARALPATYLDTLHRAALHLGRWAPVRAHMSHVTPWSSERAYGPGSHVTLDGCNYVTDARPGAVTTARPAYAPHAAFYNVFIDPSKLLCWALSAQLALVALQLTLAACTPHWHHLLAAAVLLFHNYYALFASCRDYLVAFRLYRERAHDR